MPDYQKGDLLDITGRPYTADHSLSLKSEWLPRYRDQRFQMSCKAFFSDKSPYITLRLGKCLIKVRTHCFFVGCLWHSHGKNPVWLYPKLQSQPIGLRKIFIDYFFFQVNQWDCTKPLLIFDRPASSEERFRTFHCMNKLQSQPIGLPKNFIDYLFFQFDQSDCTKSVSIFNRFASSEEH